MKQDSFFRKALTWIFIIIAAIYAGPVHLLTGFPALLGIRFFSHMLQLSSYQNPGYFRFLRKNIVRHVLPWPVAGVLLALCLSRFSEIWWILSVIYALALTILYFPRKQKKKFVVTPRIRRLFVTIACLFYVNVMIGKSVSQQTAPSEYPPLALAMVYFVAISLLPFTVALANRINQPVEQSVNNGFIKDAVRILQEQPSLRIIGVTGSYGKTSVKYYLTTVLSEQFNVLMTPESYNTPMGVVRTIREQMKPVHEIFVCEMGARHVGDIKEITDFVHPDDGILTAIGEQHMETFFTQENIVKTKYELLDAVAQKKSTNLKFVNGDNALIRANMKYPDAITYGLEEGNDFRAIDLKVTGSGTTFKIQLSRRVADMLTAGQGYAENKTADGVISSSAGTEFHTMLVGAHNIQNITGAIAVATLYGIPASKIRRGVRRIEPVPHRLELKKHGNVTILDDAFNSNPAGAKAALDTLAMFADAVKILVTPGMVELGEREDDLNKTFGTQAANECDYIILVGEKQTAAVKQGILEAGFDENRLFVKASFNEASVLMYELDAGREKVILLENDLPDNYAS